MKGTQGRVWRLVFFGLGLLFVLSWGRPAGQAGASELHTSYLPIVARNYFSVGPTLPAPQILSGAPPLNLAAIQQQLQNQGLTLGLNKIGFHTGYGGNRDGLLDWMQGQDADGIPFFLKAVDDPEPLVQAQALMQASGVPHTLVFRRTGTGFDVPDYNLPPVQSAQEHWARHLATWPAELDPSLVWIETLNEVDKNRSEWLAEFAMETARLALRDGYRWAAFGWSSGEPEQFHWEGPQMLNFLRLVADHPNQLAIALHEYSYDRTNIGNAYPWLVGRFQHLFQVVDNNGISRPTILITEWGWEYQDIPTPAEAMADIQWAAWLYAAYPQVKGAAV
ncbi:MAG: hypothetical protein KDE34_02375, partial [Anaerolineales bacterium]|nr:hypothetical protein [Anaerolineales bacterium]